MPTFKNVWYISKYFAVPTEDSTGSRGWHLLQEFGKKGVQPIVITSDSNNLTSLPRLNRSVTIDDSEHLKIIWLKTLKYGTAKSLMRVLSWFHFEWNLFWLKKNNLAKPDVVIVSSLSILTILNGILLKRKFNCKLVFEVRDIWPLTLVEEGGYSSNNIFIKFLGWVEKIGYKKSDIIVGTMPNLKQHVTDILGYAKNVECIPMGVLNHNKKPTSSIPCEYINEYLNDSYFNIVYAGTIGITNALDVYFKAAEVLNQQSGIRFVIVGDGALKKSYIKKYSHLNNVIFAPKVPKNLVHSVLSKSDVVYFSTFKSKVWNFGQSLNKIIDYMMSGKPIIGSYSGYPSMINEAECGFFVPSEDTNALIEKIIYLHGLSENDREKIGIRGRKWLLNNYNYPKLSEEYLKIIFSE